ncbi:MULTISPECIES: hypothetical protein [Acinetobacter]|uniref:hypothetical protein n=1 Tax=Acinetobacter TaxID=469 RepID=UPI000E31F8E9|nr:MULTISPECIES: hypothetical protein [Acinetobacter]MCU4635189.1 hypothetical protein [Acinetobacter sp. WU_MDCI_Abxa265]RFF25709.1 hypothetical protein DZ985_00310 [Acinetobacter sp. JW]
MKYSSEQIKKALLLTPLPLLLWHFFFKFMDVDKVEFNLDHIFAFFLGIVGYSIVYLAYCILTVPFTFIFSMLLNHYNYLNVWAICISSIVITSLFFFFLGWIFTGEISPKINYMESMEGEAPPKWWMMYTDISFIIFILFPGLCYWRFLIFLQKKQSNIIRSYFSNYF